MTGQLKTSISIIKERLTIRYVFTFEPIRTRQSDGITKNIPLICSHERPSRESVFSDSNSPLHPELMELKFTPV